MLMKEIFDCFWECKVRFELWRTLWLCLHWKEWRAGPAEAFLQIPWLWRHRRLLTAFQLCGALLSLSLAAVRSGSVPPRRHTLWVEQIQRRRKNRKERRKRGVKQTSVSAAIEHSIRTQESVSVRE